MVYNIDGEKTANEWVKYTLPKKMVSFPNMSNALNIKENDHKIADGFIGYMYNKSNNVDKNTQEVALFSTMFSDAHGISVLPDNFTKCTSVFSARKLIDCTWVNSKDEYLAPNTEHEKYKEFENDSIVYSLFNTASNQSSLRGVEYKGKKWDIKNEFFFMGRDELMQLANENFADECYEDCRKSNERYVYTLLQWIELSAEASAVLEKARELVVNSFKYRSLFNEEHPEYQIMNWDASYYQLKALWKEYFANDYKEFTELYKKLADKMRPMVYELGFLK